MSGIQRALHLSISQGLRLTACAAIALTMVSCGGDAALSDEAAAGASGATPSETEAAAKTITFTEAQYRLADITLGAIGRRQLNSVISLSGVIDVEPSNTAVVSAQLGGYLRTAGLLPGTAVRRGQLLASLESPEFTQIQQDYLESKGRMVFLEQDYARQASLREADVNAQKTFQQVASEYAIMQARIAGLEQKMQQAGIPRSAVDSGRISPVAHLYAPIDGYIKVSNVSLGRHVSPTDVLFEIVGTSDLHLALNVYAKDLEQVRVGQTVRFGTGDERTLDRSAKVFLVGQATGEDRVFPVHGHIDARSARGLRPGMFVKASLEAGGENSLAVPTAAVVQLEGVDYIVLETGKTEAGHVFRLQRVLRGSEQGGYVGIEILDAIDVESARVVVGNAAAILAAIRNAEEGD